MKKFILILFFLPLVLLGQTALTEAENFIDNKMYTKAEGVLTKFIENNPNNLKAIELLGDSYGFTTNWDQAINYYKQLVDKQPDNANYQYKYGGALGMKALNISKIQALGIIGDVKTAFITAAQLDPTHIEARWALVELYMQLPGIIGGSKSKSLHYANELEKLSKIDGYLAKGYIYEYDKEAALAAQYYKKALAVQQALPCYNSTSGGSDVQAASINTLVSAHKRHNRNGMHYQIGKVCADYNLELEKGIFCLKVYLKNYTAKDGVPKAWAYYRLSQIYNHQNNKKDALIWINKAITQLPNLEVFKKFKDSLEA